MEYDTRYRGFIYAEDRWFLPSLSLSEGDLFALMTAQYLGTAWERLRENFPGQVETDPACFTGALVLIDRTAPFDPKHWTLAFQAIRTQRKLILKYRTPGKPDSVERIVWPMRLIRHRECWYLLAFDEFRERYLLYSLSRMTDVVLSTETFDPPAGFRLEDHIDPGFGLFPPEKWFTVRLAADPGMAEMILEHLPERGKGVGDLPDGRKALWFETSQREELMHWVLQWGTHVEVLEPESLRRELFAVGEGFCRIYG